MKEKKGPPVGKPPQKPEKRSQQIIRFAETTLDGSMPVERAIRQVRGISFMFGNAIVRQSGFQGRALTDLSEAELKKLEDLIYHPEKAGVPAWLYNRRADPATGAPRHLAVSQLDLTTKTDINEMKKLRSYRGMRHALGLPVRGQRTRSSFRSGKTVGVSKGKVKKT